MMENILNNEVLMQKLADAKDAGELAAVLAENNIALDDGMTAEKLYEMINKESNESGELDMDALEDVSGGVVPFAAAAAAAVIGLTGAYLIARNAAKRRRR